MWMYLSIKTPNFINIAHLLLREGRTTFHFCKGEHNGLLIREINTIIH